MTDYNNEADLIRYIANHDEDLFKRFVALDKHLVDEVHPHVNTGAAANDAIWLTDHGPRHIKTVIRRIGELTFRNDCFVIKPKDAYLLAVAAHFHDIGNVYGREGHEKRAREELFDLDQSLIGSDNFEKRRICDIAAAHGGLAVGSKDKDTIGHLPADETTRRLAAILRFADELADDKTRTTAIGAKVMEDNECIRKQSEIYHVYAERLDQVHIDHSGDRVCLSFELIQEHLCNEYYKSGKKRYLLDEIFERTLKVHREQVYCSKFMIPHIISNRVDVDINVCSKRYERILGRFHYTLEQRGYPDYVTELNSLVPEMANLTGHSVAARIGDILSEVPEEGTELDLNKEFRDMPIHR